MQLLSTTEPQTFRGATAASDPKSAVYFVSVQYSETPDRVNTAQQQTVAQAFKYSVCLFAS